MCPWEIVKTRPLLNRAPWLTVWEEDVRLPNGETISGYVRTDARSYAMVFAVLTDGRVPLVRQYKHGIGALSFDLPAGYLETADESPLAAAQRELEEETGLTAPCWQPLAHLVVDTNRGDATAHIYLAQSAEQTAVQSLDATEALEVTYHTPEELRQMVLSGDINSIASVAGIMMALQRMDPAIQA